MTTDLSIIVLNGSGKIIRRARYAPRTLWCLLGLLMLAISVIGFGAADYYRISRKTLNVEALKGELALRNQEVIHHRKQIQKFAREINRIKSRVVEIDQMDQLIRRVADLEESITLYGMGGSVPDDLDPDLAPEHRHTRLIKEMHLQIEELEHATVIQHLSLSDLVKVVQERGDIMSYTPTIRPSEGLVSSRFGYRISPFTGKREFHLGLDIASYPETEIIATADGHIAFAGQRGGFGKLVVIDHGHGLTTRYAHLEQIMAKHGDTIKRGEIIALMGNTGRSTGTHLHYEVRLDGVPVNPERYILN